MRRYPLVLLYLTAVQLRRRLSTMSKPAYDLPADSTALADSVDNTRRSVITHLTIGGERVATATTAHRPDSRQSSGSRLRDRPAR